MSDVADPEQNLHHLEYVLLYAPFQHKNGRDFILISETMVKRTEQVDSLLKPLTSNPGIEKLPVGMRDEGWIIHPRINSKIEIHVYEVVSYIQTNSNQVTKTRNHRLFHR